MINIADIKVFNVASKEFYSYCSEKLKELDVPLFIIYVPDCSCSRYEITTDDFLEWIEYLSTSNGYFFLGITYNQLDPSTFFKKLFNLDDLQELQIENGCFSGRIHFYNGVPICFSTSQFSNKLGMIDLLAIPKYRFGRNKKLEQEILKQINIEDIKTTLERY